jgi:hypothetical protein
MTYMSFEVANENRSKFWNITQSFYSTVTKQSMEEQKEMAFVVDEVIVCQICG